MSKEPSERSGGLRDHPKRRSSADALDASVRLARLRRQMFADVESPRIGHYHVLRQIGGGGSGLVFAAWDPSVDRVIAIKLLRDSSSPSAGPDLRREADALSRLRHPNVVSVFDVGDHEGQVYLAMEYVPGRTLREHLRTSSAGRPAIRALLDIFLQIGRGLAAAHAAGLVHRDVNPDNVVIDGDGNAKLLGFGLARAALEVEITRESGTGVVALTTVATEGHRRIGMPAYMAPEQLRGHAPTPATDQFGLCACMFEALYGRTARPWRTDEAMASVEDPVDVPRRSDVPRRLRAILRRGLSLDPRARWASLPALVDELARVRGWGLGRWFFAGVLTIASAGIFAGVVLTPGDAVRCEAGLDGVWDHDERASVALAFEQLGPPTDASLSSRVVAKLDRYAEHWGEMIEESCRATFVHRVQSEQRP